eukprot:TRINITY_DN4351_c0_g3_i4.p1 TRINITY_DN4351_c0_g3~~TRINITY_DN4351_c0_g3_i4.p1  ORF type:complete len:367 (-),score=118.17 TRINITY_DN4351_c0_g3_i4:58-1158(-)
MSSARERLQKKLAEKQAQNPAASQQAKDSQKFETLLALKHKELALHSRSVFSFAQKMYEIAGRGCLFWLFESANDASDRHAKRPAITYAPLVRAHDFEYPPVINFIQRYDPTRSVVALVAIRTGDARDSLMNVVELGRTAYEQILAENGRLPARPLPREAEDAAASTAALESAVLSVASEWGCVSGLPFRFPSGKILKCPPVFTRSMCAYPNCAKLVDFTTSQVLIPPKPQAQGEAAAEATGESGESGEKKADGADDQEEQTTACPNCHLKFYCSRYCQSRHWEAGHDKKCDLQLQELLRLHSLRQQEQMQADYANSQPVPQPLAPPQPSTDVESSGEKKNKKKKKKKSKGTNSSQEETEQEKDDE